MTTVFTKNNASWLANINNKNYLLVNPLNEYYLRFVAEENNPATKIKLIKKDSNAPTVSLEYSMNGVNWHSYTIGQDISLPKVGDFVMFRAGPNGNTNFAATEGVTLHSRNYKYNKFQIAGGKVAAYGNIMSLLNRYSCSTTLPSNNTFTYLFYGCDKLTRAPKLPAKHLTVCCYADMFRDCTSLKEIPELPATELADYCYLYMFAGCTALTSVKYDFHASDIPLGAYYIMFANCTSLTSIGSLNTKNKPLNNVDKDAFYGMLSGCTALLKAPDIYINGSIGYHSCFTMFKNCTSLTAVPRLRISSLNTNYSAQDSSTAFFGNMFNNCTSLSSVPFDYLKNSSSVISSNTFNSQIKITHIYSNMFESCTSLTAAPFIYNCALSSNQYVQMFAGCTKLSALSTDFENYHEGMHNILQNTALTGTLYCKQIGDLNSNKANLGINNNWTIEQLAI